MSYDIRIKCAHCHQTIRLDTPHDLRGGTYCVGGTTECWINITYNYGDHFRRVFNDKNIIQVLDGKSIVETIELIETAINQLCGEPSDDYWQPTEGNAKKSLQDLLALAKLAPGGVWQVN